MQLFNITRWPSVAIFVLAGLMVMVSAFASVNLFTQTMANFDFITSYGLLAIRLGALWQLAGLFMSGVVALTGFLIFKICEVEMVTRYRAWAARSRRPAEIARDPH